MATIYWNMFASNLHLIIPGLYFLLHPVKKKDIEAALKMGTDDYIVKPFAGDDLLNTINKLLS